MGKNNDATKATVLKQSEPRNVTGNAYKHPEGKETHLTSLVAWWGRVWILVWEEL